MFSMDTDAYQNFIGAIRSAAATYPIRLHGPLSTPLYYGIPECCVFFGNLLVRGTRVTKVIFIFSLLLPSPPLPSPPLPSPQ